jgi:hypothetical protein
MLGASLRLGVNEVSGVFISVQPEDYHFERPIPVRCRHATAAVDEHRRFSLMFS